MKIPILRGRNLMPGETHTVIVSQSLARRLWPAEDPLGKRLPFGEDPTVAPTIVGISGNARMVKLEDPDLVELYSPMEPAICLG